MRGNILGRILSRFIVLILIFSMLLTSMAMQADAVIFTNPEFSYDETTGVITSKVILGDRDSLKRIYRYFVCFVDPAAIDADEPLYGVADGSVIGMNGRVQKISNLNKNSDTATIDDFLNDDIECYVFSFELTEGYDYDEPRPRRPDTVTLKTYEKGTDATILDYEHSATKIAADNDLCKSGKTISDLWGKKDWLVFIGPNFEYRAADSNDNLYAVDSYLGKASELFDEAILSDVSADEITYGQTLADSTIKGTAKVAGHTVTGTWTFEDSTVMPSVSDSESTEYNVIFVPDKATMQKYPELKPSKSKVTVKVNKKQLSVIGSKAEDKIYDGNTTAGVIPGTLNGAVNGDDVKLNVKSATFDDENVGNNKNVTVIYELKGEDIDNYSLSLVEESLTANILAVAIEAKANDMNNGIDTSDDNHLMLIYALMAMLSVAGIGLAGFKKH